MSIIDVLKEAGKLAQEYNKMELYQQLLVVQAELADLKTENIELKERVRDLERRVDLENRLVFERSVYWIKNDPQANGGDTPICPQCWDAERKAFRLTVRQYSGGAGILCNNCKHVHFLQ